MSTTSFSLRSYLESLFFLFIKAHKNNCKKNKYEKLYSVFYLFIYLFYFIIQSEKIFKIHASREKQPVKSGHLRQY